MVKEGISFQFHERKQIYLDSIYQSTNVFTFVLLLTKQMATLLEIGTKDEIESQGVGVRTPNVK